MLKLCQDRRGTQKELTYVGNRAMVKYDLPLNEVVFDFYDRLKSVSKGYGFSTEVASVYAYLGDRDRAFAWLERSFQERNGGLIVLRVEPLFEPLHSDPRFERLAQRVGLAPLRTPARTSRTPG